MLWFESIFRSDRRFFFKQKTAYEMLRSLVGSEMCIRDRAETGTELLHVSDGTGGNVAVGIGGTLVSPPLSVSQVEH